MSSRILVAGGAGFIGSHLCRKLLASGNEVICLDNFYTGQRSNLVGLENNDRFELLEADVTKALDIEVDQIYNLACPASPVHYQKDPILTAETGILGTINLLRLADSRNAVFVQASTSEVYGDPLIHPQTEDYWGNVNPIGTRACYDEGKRVGETLCFDYHRQKGTQVKIARIFNTYGPNMALDDGRVVSNLIIQALRGEEITIYGDGSQTRSFCFVADLIEGLIQLMETEPSQCGPINLGSPEEVSVRTLAELILELTDSKSQLTHRPLPAGDPKRRCPDISRAKSMLGWQPVIALREGLRETIQHLAALVH